MRFLGFDLFSSGRLGRLLDGASFLPRNEQPAPLAVTPLSHDAVDAVTALVDRLVSIVPAHISIFAAQPVHTAVDATAEQPAVAAVYQFIVDDTANLLADDSLIFVFSAKELPDGYELGLKSDSAPGAYDSAPHSFVPANSGDLGIHAAAAPPEVHSVALAAAPVIVPHPVAANDDGFTANTDSNSSNIRPLALSIPKPVDDGLHYTLEVIPSRVSGHIGGYLSSSTFAADLETAASAAVLGAHEGVIFDPDSGNMNLAGHSYLIVDVNGIAGYQAGADHVIELFTSTGTLNLDDFI